MDFTSFIQFEESDALKCHQKSYLYTVNIVKKLSKKTSVLICTHKTAQYSTGNIKNMKHGSLQYCYLLFDSG